MSRVVTLKRRSAFWLGFLLVIIFVSELLRTLPSRFAESMRSTKSDSTAHTDRRTCPSKCRTPRRRIPATKTVAKDPEIYIEEAFRDLNKNLTRMLLANESTALPTTYDEPVTWKTVLPHTYAYSAYLECDTRGHPYVRIVAIVQTNGNSHKETVCHVSAGNSTVSTPAVLKPVPEHHNRWSTAAFFICNLTNHGHVLAHDNLRVSLASAITKQSGPHWIEVTKRGNLSHDFALCVRPMMGCRDHLVQMAEFVAYYTVLGVTRFTFYLYSVSQAERQLLLRLRQRKNVTIVLLHWNLPVRDIHAFGQMAAVQDCVHRERFYSGYILHVDFDEFVVPKTARDLYHFTKAFENDASIGSFNVLHKPFCSEFRTTVPRSEARVPLLTHIYNVRDSIVWPHGQRSKWISRPEAIVAAGIHFIWEFEPQKKSLDTNESQILLHHYRTCQNLAIAANDMRLVLESGSRVYDPYMETYVEDILSSDPFAFIEELLSIT